MKCEKIEMHFLPDVYVICDVCGGKRYNRETLEVKFKGLSIWDILNLTVDKAYEFFKNIPSITRILNTLKAVGLGYKIRSTSPYPIWRRSSKDKTFKGTFKTIKGAYLIFIR